MLNASPDRCDALIVRIGGVDVVPLPVTHEEVLARVNRYGNAVNELNKAAQTLAGRQAAENELSRVLAWLWDSTAQPVLDALGLLDVVANSPWPRVWWSPGGLFSLFRSPQPARPERVIEPGAIVVCAVVGATCQPRLPRGRARIRPAAAAARSRAL